MWITNISSLWNQLKLQNKIIRNCKKTCWITVTSVYVLCDGVFCCTVNTSTAKETKMWRHTPSRELLDIDDIGLQRWSIQNIFLYIFPPIRSSAIFTVWKSFYVDVIGLSLALSLSLSPSSRWPDFSKLSEIWYDNMIPWPPVSSLVDWLIDWWAQSRRMLSLTSINPHRSLYRPY